jgi:hypothetical protein
MVALQRQLVIMHAKKGQVSTFTMGPMMGRKSPSEEHRLRSPWWMVGRAQAWLLVMHVKEGRTKTFVAATK